MTPVTTFGRIGMLENIQKGWILVIDISRRRNRKYSFGDFVIGSLKYRELPSLKFFPHPVRVARYIGRVSAQKYILHSEARVGFQVCTVPRNMTLLTFNCILYTVSPHIYGVIHFLCSWYSQITLWFTKFTSILPNFGQFCPQFSTRNISHGI